MNKGIFLTCLLLLCSLHARAEDASFSKYDFAGMGVSEGEASRMAERANDLNADSYSSGDFSGLGVSSDVGVRAANQLNDQNNSNEYPVYQSFENENQGSRLTSDDY